MLAVGSQIEKKVSGRDATEKDVDEARKILRLHLIETLQLERGATLAEALSELKNQAQPNQEIAGIILRCLGVPDLIPRSTAENQIARSIVEICEKSLPLVSRYFQVESKKQNHEKYAILMEIHR
ncbi:hypothetical protein [Methylobacterium sp. R2-1]|uniref:hypothetical protein n=1 Tax=Methylobacterium sp. R2-1 TaxID=2587064 RepID=UPI00160CE76B|nr:hypothetical protein [Methylobacterium sp. R2-1]MBB2962554.1 hypothetical protein [Methylobacterium sp. R2-1]